LAQMQQPKPSGSNNITLTREPGSSPQVFLRPQISRQSDPYLLLGDKYLAHYAGSEQRSQNMYPSIG
ncbi:hypothetical protein KI387_001562, partial [Taxus chinensis]